MHALGQRFDLGRQSGQAFAHIARGAAGIVQQGVHQRRADDHTVGVAAHGARLLGGRDADAHADVPRPGAACALDQYLGGRRERIPLPRDAHARGRVDEAPRVARGVRQTLVAGIRGHQEDPVQSVPLRGLDPFAGLVGDQIRRDDAGAAGVRQIVREPFHPVMEDHVPVAHDQRHAAGVRHGLHRTEHAGHAFAVVQRHLRGGLDDRAVHHRIGVGQADLHRVDAMRDHRAQRVMGGFGIREPVRHIADEGGTVLRAERVEHGLAGAGAAAEAQRLWSGGLCCCLSHHVHLCLTR